MRIIYLNIWLCRSQYMVMRLKWLCGRWLYPHNSHIYGFVGGTQTLALWALGSVMGV